MNKFKDAYIAGYIDGDGCFYIGKTNAKHRITPKYQMSIIISSVNIGILHIFKEQYGGSISSRKPIKDHKPLHYWSLRKNDSLILCSYIEKYIIEKRDQLELYKQFASIENIQELNRIIFEMSIIKETGHLVAKSHKAMLNSFKNTIIPNEEDFAYLAGFIDAECNFGIQKYKPKDKPNYVYKILLQFNNTKFPVFKWLVERFGGQIYFINRISNGYSRKNQLSWRLSGKALFKILDKIHPFIHHKKPVLEKLIEFHNTTLKNGGARHTQIFREEYASIIKKREEIVNTIHLLNSKGISKT